MEIERESIVPASPSTPTTPTNKKKKKKKAKKAQETAPESPLPPVREDADQENAGQEDPGGVSLERTVTEQSLQSVTTLGDEEGSVTRKGSKKKKKKARTSSVSSLSTPTQPQFPGVPESLVEYTTIESQAGKPGAIGGALSTEDNANEAARPQSLQRDHTPAELNLSLARQLSRPGPVEPATPATPATPSTPKKKRKGKKAKDGNQGEFLRKQGLGFY